MSDGDIAIIGAGLSGCLLANLLGQAGFGVDIFEKRPDPEIAAGSAGRSLSLGLSRAGLEVLCHSGLEREILDASVSLAGRQFHLEGGGIHFEAYAAPPVPGSILSAQGGARAITRPDLNRLLGQHAAQRPGVEFYFAHELEDLEPISGRIQLRADGQIRTGRYRIIIGADGASSTTRRLLALHRGFEQDEQLPGITYKELRIPLAADGKPRLATDAVHIWPRLGSVLFAVPCSDGTFAAALFLHTKGHPSFETLTSGVAIRDFFHRSMPDVISLAPALVAHLQSAPLGRLVSIRCNPWHVGNVVLMGDACHAMIPFAGQGANSALEDGLELARCVEKYSAEPPRAFAEYSSKRQPVTDHLTRFSLAITPLMMNLGALGAALGPGAMQSIDAV